MLPPVVMGVDVGGTNVKVAFATESGEVLAQASWPTNASEGPVVFAERLKSEATQLAAENHIEWSQLQAVGVGLPGFLNMEEGKLELAVNLHWKNVEIVRLLQESLQKPIVMDNDANAAALGEVWLGAGRDAKIAVCVTLGTGVGGGIILDGKVHRGVSVMAGEIGHIVMKPGGDLCNCGHRGCLETLTSATALAKAGSQAGLVSPQGSSNPLTSEDIFNYAETGNDSAKRVINEMVDWLGLALANLANVLNPDVFVISGGVVNAGDALLVPLRNAFLSHALERAATPCRIVAATLGSSAGVLGCARLAWQSVESRA